MSYKAMHSQSELYFTDRSNLPFKTFKDKLSKIQTTGSK